MKLICEVNDDVQYITEAAEDGKAKNYFIEGVFMQGDLKNRNGRVYPSEVIAKEVKRYNKEFVEKKRAFGELGHPNGPTINLDRVSHMITNLQQEGSNFVGKAKIMDTPMGKVVKNLMDEGATLGVSSRGMGSLDQKGGVNYVRSDFKLATAGDIVADPSAPSAFVEGIMEGKEWVWNHGSLIEAQVFEMKERIEQKVRARQNKEQALEFAKFLKML